MSFPLTTDTARRKERESLTGEGDSFTSLPLPPSLSVLVLDKYFIFWRLLLFSFFSGSSCRHQLAAARGGVGGGEAYRIVCGACFSRKPVVVVVVRGGGIGLPKVIQS